MENQQLNWMQVEQSKVQLRVCEDDVKQQNRMRWQLEKLKAKSLIKEEERERKKSQYDVISVTNDGKLYIETENLLIHTEARKMANFEHPEIIVFRQVQNPERELFQFMCDINSNLKTIFFAAEECGSANYLLKRLSSIGAEIFAPTLAMKKKYALQLFSLLFSNTKEEYMLPERRGWYLDLQGKLVFFQGKWSWEEAAKCVK